MARKSFSGFTGRDIIIAVSMLAIIAAVLLAGDRSTYLRSKAYTHTATGVRIEAEEMTLTNIQKDPTGTYVQF